MDRGVDTIKLYELLQRLQKEAALEGGRVVRTLGNHELMNMVGDWRYVHPADIDTFGGKKQRMQAFSPEGWIGGDLVQLNLTAKVGNSVFCHGCIHPNFAKDGLDALNTKTRETIMDYIESRGRLDPHGVFGGRGPTWYRGYALDDNICPTLEKALDDLKVNAYFKAVEMR